MASEQERLREFAATHGLNALARHGLQSMDKLAGMLANNLDIGVRFGIGVGVSVTSCART